MKYVLIPRDVVERARELAAGGDEDRAEITALIDLSLEESDDDAFETVAEAARTYARHLRGMWPNSPKAASVEDALARIGRA